MNGDPTAASSNLTTGKLGEDIAVSFLEGKRYRIVERNYRCKGGEVDIVARDGGTLVFVEVKARKSLSYGVPQLAVTPFKQRQIMKAALTWLARHKQHDAAARFDVVAISLRDGSAPEIEHIINAFELTY